jgi:NAD(P)-dependent dehydrogenase (short-subunit alcohol dehydrogenase family)
MCVTYDTQLRGVTMISAWNTTNIPPQTGKLAVVTGATGGLGYQTALELAQVGAEVLLAGRKDSKGRDAVQQILAFAPHATVRFEKLDLASLKSVSAFADRLLAEGRAIDLLINNAGVMSLPTRQTTADGFEMQFGTNYLGHFALTAHLLPLLVRGQQPRVVNLSSLTHHIGHINFDDLQAQQNYSPNRVYGQSKLAMLLFAFELQRRSDGHGWRLMSNAAHPGTARTDLVKNGLGANGNKALSTRVINFVVSLVGQSAAAGALPTLFAATSPQAKGGAYYGPDGFVEVRGAPAPAKVASQAKDVTVAARLWEISEQLTGVRFEEQVTSV